MEPQKICAFIVLSAFIFIIMLGLANDNTLFIRGATHPQWKVEQSRTKYLAKDLEEKMIGTLERIVTLEGEVVKNTAEAARLHEHVGDLEDQLLKRTAKTTQLQQADSALENQGSQKSSETPQLQQALEAVESQVTQKTAETTQLQQAGDAVENQVTKKIAEDGGGEGSCKNQPNTLKAMMASNEQQLMKSYITPTTRYFEWGSGGSTDTYSRLTSNTVVSIENYKPWCDKVSTLPYVQCRQNQGTLHYKCIVPYPTKDAGYPVDAAHNGDFDEYINAIEDYPNFDVVLVDARWRVACALKALDYITDDTVVFMHDMGPRRNYYDSVFKWYKEIERAGSLVAMRRRKGVLRPTEEEFTTYKHQPKW